jgi:hypothetical protein
MSDKNTMRLGIHIPAYGRHELLRRVHAQLEEAIWPCLEDGTGIEDVRIAVAGNAEDDVTCATGEPWADLFAPVSNHDLATKFTVSCQLLRGARVDGCMVLGSDDMVSPGYLMGVCKLLEQGYEYIGTTDCLSYTEATGKWHYLDRAEAGIGGTVGAGRCMSISALEACDWVPWPPTNSREGMDSWQERRMLQAYPYAKRWAGTMEQLGGWRIGVKTEGAISDISRLGVEVEPTQEQKELVGL